MNPYEIQIVEKPAYHAVGMKWKGTFQEAGEGGVRKTINLMKGRMDEILQITHPDILLGLSYHDIPGGFSHYSVFEVSKVNQIPEGMISKTVPSFTYLRVKHHSKQSINQTYRNIAAWLKNSDYVSYRDPNIIYYDDFLPIKHEAYNLENIDSNDHEYDIMIPVVKGK